MRRRRIVEHLEGVRVITVRVRAADAYGTRGVLA